MIAEADVKYAEERWPGAELGSVRYGYLEGVRMEREACARIAEGNINGDLRTWPHQSGDYDNVSVQSRLADAIAAAIRARST